jgi:hypothetical protein
LTAQAHHQRAERQSKKRRKREVWINLGQLARRDRLVELRGDPTLELRDAVCCWAIAIVGEQ